MTGAALVLGAGVSGLTVACRLQDDGWRVRIWTSEEPGSTTSAVAAAIWYPYRAGPRDRVLDWGRRSLARFIDLARDPAAGVVLCAGLEVFREPTPDPWWMDAVPDVQRAGAEDLPDGFVDGLELRLPVIEMPIYLRWLLRRFVAGGGELSLRTVDGLAEATGRTDVVVNCTGLGARDLVDDGTVEPVRGQVVRVANPGLERFALHHADTVTYVVPRSHDVVLGGTADVGEWDTGPDPDVAEDIRERCRQLVPQLDGAPVIGHAAGLRPVRPEVRLERADVAGTPVVHDYGHGGAGVTLSWGCADEVARLVC